jgi:hypothetical protein
MHMKKVVYTYGLISGTIVALLMWATIPLWNGKLISSDYGMLVGYTTQVIALSLVFFGVKSYRDNHAGGIITFGQGVRIGLLISLITVVMYGLAWEVTYNFWMTDFDTLMLNSYREKMQTSGATQAEIAEKMKSMEEFFVMYKNPLIRFGTTLMEIVPIGLIITLLSATLLRRKEFLPATTSETVNESNSSQYSR